MPCVTLGSFGGGVEVIQRKPVFIIVVTAESRTLREEEGQTSFDLCREKCLQEKMLWGGSEL